VQIGKSSKKMLLFSLFCKKNVPKWHFLAFFVRKSIAFGNRVAIFANDLGAFSFYK
jgi:hypothetical protein